RGRDRSRICINVPGPDDVVADVTVTFTAVTPVNRGPVFARSRVAERRDRNVGLRNPERLALPGLEFLKFIGSGYFNSTVARGVGIGPDRDRSVAGFRLTVNDVVNGHDNVPHVLAGVGVPAPDRKCGRLPAVAGVPAPSRAVHPFTIRDPT